MRKQPRWSMGEPCECCGKVWENGDCFTTPARTVRCALIQTRKIRDEAYDRLAAALPSKEEK